LVDLKKELYSRDLGDGRRQILSIGPGVGFTDQQIDRFGGSTNLGTVELAAPVYFGHQFETVELVFSARFFERLLFTDKNGDEKRDLAPSEEFGLAVGLFGRGKTKQGLELGYQSSFSYPGGGVFLLSLGISFDVGSKPVIDP
jgi:hypothetical protein